MYKMLLKTYCVVIFENWNLIELIVVHNYCKEQMNIKIHNIMHLINIFFVKFYSARISQLINECIKEDFSNHSISTF